MCVCVCAENGLLSDREPVDTASSESSEIPTKVLLVLKLRQEMKT